MRLGIQLVVIAVLALVGYLVWQTRADLPIIGPYFAESSAGQRSGGGAVLVDVAPVKPMKESVTLATIKADEQLAEIGIDRKDIPARAHECIYGTPFSVKIKRA